MTTLQGAINEMIVENFKRDRRVEMEKSEENFINFLYWKEGKSLRKIGKLFGISHEWVRHKMKKYGTKRRRAGWPEGSCKRKPKFDSLEEYFEFVKRTGKESILYLHKFIDPLKQIKGCEICEGRKFLRFHYLKKPVTSMGDMQLICATCFYANMRKGINNLVKDRICKKYLNGIKGLELAKEHKCSVGNIYRILKTRNIKTRRRSSDYSLMEKLRVLNGINYNSEKTLIMNITKSEITIATYYKWKKELIKKWPVDFDLN